MLYRNALIGKDLTLAFLTLPLEAFVMAMFQKDDICLPAPVSALRSDAFAEIEGAEYKAGVPQRGGQPAVRSWHWVPSASLAWAGTPPANVSQAVNDDVTREGSLEFHDGR